MCCYNGGQMESTHARMLNCRLHGPGKPPTCQCQSLRGQRIAVHFHGPGLEVLSWNNLQDSYKEERCCFMLKM